MAYTKKKPHVTLNGLGAHHDPRKKHRAFQLLAGLGATSFPDGSTSPIQMGSSNSTMVKYIQDCLNIQGANPQLAKDGIFGSKTRDMVVAFQKVNGITANGIVDIGTLTKLEDDNAISIPKSGTPKDTTLPVGPPTLPIKLPTAGSITAFFKKNKKQIMIGGAVVGVLTVAALAFGGKKPKKSVPAPVKLAIPA